MANFECKGLDKLIKRIENMATVPEEIKEEVVREGAEDLLKEQKKDAPKETGDGAKALKITEERKGEGYCFMDVGIDETNFDECRGLYFQNLEGEKSTGKHIMWMQKSFKKSEKRIANKIKDKLIQELDL